MKLPDCPVETTLLFLDDSSKILIVGYLLQGPLRFSQLRERIPKVSETSLRSGLRELAQRGVISGKLVQNQNPDAEYSLTGLGESFSGILAAVEDWGRKQYLAPQPQDIHVKTG